MDEFCCAFRDNIEKEHTLSGKKSYKVLGVGTPFGIGEGLFSEVSEGSV